jgi:hypothetical protein
MRSEEGWLLCGWVGVMRDWLSLPGATSEGDNAMTCS